MKKRIELHAKTKYSIDHESTLDIKELILKCISNGEKGVAIVDGNSVIGLYKAEKILKELDINDFKLIYGVEVNAFYNDNVYKVVVLLKNKKGVPILFRMLSPYFTNNRLSLGELLKNRKDFVIGLVYDQNNYGDDLLAYFDYIEVDDKVSKDTILHLKKETMVIYSNKINALSSEEELCKKFLYDKLNIKKEVDNRVYQNTEEILDEVNDEEIVINNPNKIFGMIEKFDLVDDNMCLLCNDDFDIELLARISLNKKYSDDIPKEVIKRVEEELKLISEFNYDGYINLYKKIIDKCREDNEEYVICDYINYLYIAYLLDITHFDPIKLDFNYDMFFSNKPNICIKTSVSYKYDLLKYIKNNLNINTIKCKSLMKLTGNLLKREFDSFEEKNNIRLNSKQKVIILKKLKDYPINDHAITSKEFILPDGFNIFKLSPRELINDGSSYQRFINIDYKDVEDKFITLEILSFDDVACLNELKSMTSDEVIICNYKDKNIIEREEFKNYLKKYDNDLILDDLYEDLIDSDIELPEIFNIINEIKKEKSISEDSKDMLIKNNIKLKQYYNISFINRGILYERLRLEYELLYFKVYYPLEYYYVMLKDCSFNDVIQIIKKGYNEILNKIKDYSGYRYEYKYLGLVKELYESDINFDIEERIILEDYCFELDKENNKIILVLNKTNEEIDKYLFNNLSVIGTRPVNGKMPYISKILYKLLEKNKDIILFGLDGAINFYLEYLLSEITGLDRKVIRQYLNPCSCFKGKSLSIDKERYINGLKYLLYHDLSIRDYHSIDDVVIDGAGALLDKLIYMIKNSGSEIIIIDRIESIKDDLEEVLIKLSNLAKETNIKIIMFTNLKREYEELYKKDMSSFENSSLLDKYINYINILDGEELFVVRGGNKRE